MHMLLAGFFTLLFSPVCRNEGNGANYPTAAVCLSVKTHCPADSGLRGSIVMARAALCLLLLQWFDALAAPRPVSARICCASKEARSALARALRSVMENSQIPRKASGIENSAGEV